MLSWGSKLQWNCFVSRPRGADIAKSTRSLPTAFSDREVPNQPIIATEIAASRTREPITVMIPLLWLPVNNGQVLSIQNSPVPASPVVRDMPLAPQLRIGYVRCWSNCGKHLLFQSISHFDPTRRWRVRRSS